MKVFCLNSLPNRIKNLDIIIPNILEQCDLLHINTINYKLDKYNYNNPKIILNHYNEMGSEGRFIHYNNYDDEIYYFTIDDDILYPKNYSDILIKTHKEVGKGIISVHSSNLLYNKKNYSKREILNYRMNLNKTTKFDVAGVGTSCFYKKDFKINYKDFKYSNMSDPYIYKFSKEQKLPIYSVKRENNWLKPLNEYGSRIFGNNNYKLINKVI